MVPHFHIFMSSVPLFRCLMVAVLFFIFPSSIPNSFYLFITLLCPLFPHLSILKTFMPLCWDLDALCAIDPCLIYRVSFLVPPQPFLPLHILLIQTLQSVLQISATMRLLRSPKLKLWKTLLPSRLGSSYLQNWIKERLNSIHPQGLRLQNHLHAFNYTSYRVICWVFLKTEQQ